MHLLNPFKSTRLPHVEGVPRVTNPHESCRRFMIENVLLFDCRHASLGFRVCKIAVAEQSRSAPRAGVHCTSLVCGVRSEEVLSLLAWSVFPAVFGSDSVHNYCSAVM